MRLAESCSSPLPHRGGLLLARGSFRPPPSANIWLTRVNYILYKCGSQNRAGRSLAPAEARYSHSLIHAVSPQAAARISMPFRKTGVTPARSSPPPHCGGLLLARGSFRPPPSANIWLTRVNYILYKCGSQNRAGRSLCPAEARYSHSSFTRSLRRLRPEICAENLKKSPENTKITKKACKLLYDSIICTTFGASDPSEKT